MRAPQQNQETKANWLLIAIGLLLIVIGIFFDPIDSSPDTGIIDLGPVGSKWLVGSLGSIFVLAGLWNLFKKHSRNQ
jgi:hypothetical protein